MGVPKCNILHARRARNAKLRKLRVRFAGAKSGAEKEKILGKVARIAPWVSPEAFTAPLKKH